MNLFMNSMISPVAPHAGAWIETQIYKIIPFFFQVAPHAGAWIETGAVARLPARRPGRAPRGRVD